MNTQPVADRFAFKTADALRRKAEELGAALPFDQDIGVLLEETVVGGRRVPNRIAAQPMEGCDSTPEGAPADLTVRRYERFGAGGAGLIWFEATSVVGGWPREPEAAVHHAGHRVRLPPSRRRHEGGGAAALRAGPRALSRSAVDSLGPLQQDGPDRRAPRGVSQSLSRSRNAANMDR